MKRAILFYLVCIALCYAYPCRAQDNRIEPPRLSVKWSMLHLLYFYPSFQVAVEHKLFKNVNLQYDLGWILDYTDSKEYKDKRGFRGIAELRYYIPSPPKIPFYIAGEFYYSRIKFDRSEVIGYDCANGDCSYFEYITYKVEHHHQGAGLKYGMLLFPGWNRNRSLFFDINGGFAFRNISYTDIGKQIPLGAELTDNNGSTHFTPRENDHSEFRLVLGARIGYRFF